MPVLWQRVVTTWRCPRCGALHVDDTASRRGALKCETCHAVALTVIRGVDSGARSPGPGVEIASY